MDRRRTRRGPPFDAAAVRLRSARTASLIDVSTDGLGVVTDGRLAPGAPVDVVLFDGRGARTRRAVVVHARVCNLHPTQGARFRVGLRLASEGRPVGTTGQLG